MAKPMSPGNRRKQPYTATAGLQPYTGTPLNKNLSDNHHWRAAAGIIMQRLIYFVLGQTDDAGNAVGLTTNQLAAANTILRKVIPDLAATTLTVEHTEAPTREEIQDRIKLLIAARPELIDMLPAQHTINGSATHVE
jgi:hypothetical protein